MNTARVVPKPWRTPLIATALALFFMCSANATTLSHNAWGTNYSIDCTTNNALQFNATRNPTVGAGSFYVGNTLYVLSDVTHWYANFPCWESTTWTSNGTGRKAARVSGAVENLYPTSAADYYLPADRFIKLRNLTIDNVDLDYDNTALWFFTSGAVTPAPDISLTLNNGSITGLNPPTFDSRARFNLSATGDSSIANWWTRINVNGTTTLNVSGAGSKLTLFRVGSTSAGNANALYFDGAGNTAVIDGATLKLDQSSMVFGRPSTTPGDYGRMTFQNNATLELAGADTKLQSSEVSFVNSRLAMGLGITRLTVDARLTLNGANVDIAGSGKVTTPVLDVLGSDTITLPAEYNLTDYTMLASIVVMQPDSSLTLTGQGSLASDFELRWSFAPSGHYGQIVINDGASLVNTGGLFTIIPGAPITIGRTSGLVSGRLVVKNGGTTALLGSSSYFANVINQGEIEAIGNGAYNVTAGTFHILGGSQGVIIIGDDGGLDLGNVGTTLGATAALNTDNRVELNNFSTLRLTIDPTARRNSQLRTSSDVFISNFAELNLSLVNDQLLPVGTKLILIDYATLSGTGGVAGVANRYFHGYPNGSSFVLGLNRYRINYTDTADAGFAAAVTLTVIRDSQSITFPAPGAQAPAGTQLALSATSTSGLAVLFTSQTPAVCTVSGVNGSTVMLVAMGTCTIRAGQAGDASYDPAVTVDRSFSVGLANTQFTLSSSANIAAYGELLTLTAHVGGASPTGKVDFVVTFQGASGPVTKSLCSGIGLVAGAATCNVPGDYQKVNPLNFQAAYTGDRNNPAATTWLTQMVSLSHSTLSVSVSSQQPVAGRSLTLNALLIQRGVSGVVSFYENGVALPGCGSIVVTAVGGSTDTGAGSCTINAVSAGSHTYVVTVPSQTGPGFEQAYVVVNVAANGPLDYSDLWWGGMAENGWGISVTQHGSIQFVVLFVYDNAGNPIWYVMPGGSWNGTNNVYSGALYNPTSSPNTAYDASRYSANTPVGSATIAYSSDSTATLSYTINGVSGSKQIVREPYVGADNQPRLQVNDMWWAGSQENGWGLSIDQHGTMLFPVWYTYDAAGKATFYAVPGGAWNGTTFTGDLYHPTSSAWLGVPYDAKVFNPNKVGTMSLSFVDQNTATMIWTVDGVTRTSTITRQPY